MNKILKVGLPAVAVTSLSAPALALDASTQIGDLVTDIGTNGAAVIGVVVAIGAVVLAINMIRKAR